MAGLVVSPRKVSLGDPGTGFSASMTPPGWAHLDYVGGPILMRAETEVERRWRLQACRKEPWTAAWLDTIGPRDLLFNIGACVGSYALIAAYRGARVVAVEASPVNAARLAQNASENILAGSIVLALGVCGPSEQPQGVGLGSQTPGAADIKVIGSRLVNVVLPGVTLDGLADTYGQPTHLLIDVDGGELDVLRGGSEALGSVREVMLECSTESRLAEVCRAILADAGLPGVETWDQRDGVKIEGVTYSLYRRAT